MQTTTSENENTSLLQEQNDFPKFSVLCQIGIGLVCGVLNLFQGRFQGFATIPLFMDTMFISLASFFGLISGLVSATVNHLLFLVIEKQEVIKLVWALCSYSIVFIIRIYIRKKSKLFLMDIINLIFLTAVIISIEGALIFTVLHALVKYNEDSVIRSMFFMLIRSNFSTFVSALLPRIPVNILDKGISIAFGFFVYKGIKKLYETARKNFKKTP
ncbi:MAG: hypothetical protein ACI4LX_06475 [Treponema sp.]